MSGGSAFCTLRDRPQIDYCPYSETIDDLTILRCQSRQVVRPEKTPRRTRRTPAVTYPPQSRTLAAALNHTKLYKHWLISPPIQNRQSLACCHNIKANDTYS
ncbi:hypothetical protein MPC1_60014 [Methylocella tundrae]|nr:hypothetical protein MPC1_60014 [Methylocella tundrae]